MEAQLVEKKAVAATVNITIEAADVDVAFQQVLGRLSRQVKVPGFRPGKVPVGVLERRIGVRFQYEWHDDNGEWYRSYGNELWEFDDNGLMRRREASINDVMIAESDRRFVGDDWQTGELPLR